MKTKNYIVMFYRYPVTIQRILSEVLALHELLSNAVHDEDKVFSYDAFFFF